MLRAHTQVFFLQRVTVWHTNQVKQLGEFSSQSVEVVGFTSEPCEWFTVLPALCGDHPVNMRDGVVRTLATFLQ